MTKSKVVSVGSQARGLSNQPAGTTRLLPVIKLREVRTNDLDFFFAYQQDREANYMAAFTSRDPSDRTAFDAHWKKILADSTVMIQTVVYKGQVAGSMLSYVMDGKPEIGYWIGKEYWGKGIASLALALFLKKQTTRPIYAHTAKDNLASIRVLQK
jgi:RimJ/RimL family protein N-acetyltransferase